MISLRFPRFSFRTGTVAFGLTCGGIFGLALFLGIADLGFARIWNEVLSVKFGLVGIVLVHIAQLLFCCLAWRILLSHASPHGAQKVTSVLILRWIRESVDNLLPVAQLGGEVASARLLTLRGISLPVASASIIADVTIETLTQAVFTLMGLALIFTLTDPGDAGHWAALGFAIAVVFASLLVLAQRWGGIRLFEKLLLAIADKMGWNRLEGIAGLDTALSQVYRLHEKLLVAALYHLIAWSLGAFEVMIAAWALGYHLDLGQAYVIESLAQAMRSAAFFVPGAVGVQEGAFVVLAGLFGIPPDAAISISLTKRVRELVLGLPGLVVWQIHELRLRRARRETRDASANA